MLNLRESSQAEIFSRVKESFPLFHLSLPPPPALTLLFYLPQQATTGSTIAPLSKYDTSDHQHGQPSWLAASTSLSHVSGRGPPICVGCCQLFVMRRHPPNVIKSLKVSSSWKGVYTCPNIKFYLKILLQIKLYFFNNLYMSLFLNENKLKYFCK